ncbi:MAG: S9 family peptidase [Gemmatimonadota bacterium]
MTRTVRTLRLATLLLIAAPWAAAAQQNAGQLSLDRIFNSGEFASDRFGPVRWLVDGSGYTTVEVSPRVRGYDIVRYEPGSGARAVLVAAERLIPTGSRAPLILEDYEWSDDGSKLLVYTNSERVWRVNSRGDYWVLDLQSGKLQKLGGDAPASTLMFAKFSHQADRVAYVRQNDIYVERLEDGQITKLTEGGSPTLINGTFDWAYEEEFGIRDGFRWSPDGTRIAYWQLDSSGVKEFLLVNDTDSLYPIVTRLPYPKVGEVLSAARVGVVPAAGGATVWAQLQGDPRNNYIARMEWAANSEQYTVQYLNRPQNTNQLVMVAAATGAVQTIYTDEDPAWVDAVDDMRWMDGGARFTWVSEKDGWRHVYVVSRDGQEQLITPWPLDVVNIELIDDRGGWLYFIASPDNATQRYLYRSRLDGRGEPQRLTPEQYPGWNSYQLSQDGSWAFQTYSAFSLPSTVRLVSLPDHRSVRTMVDNAALKETVAALDRGESEFFQVTTEEGVVMDGWIMKPPHFDPARKYPLLFYVYGEPAAQTVTDSWGGSRYLWHLMLTQQGYLVASVENRGTPAPRGREWRKSVHGEIGTLASRDQAGAARVIRDWDFVDAERIGIWGWSGGGSMTLNMMFRSPDIYRTGMSVAPVPDQRLYDAIYQERYSGVLPDFADGYQRGSPITHVDGLRGNLLLVHGSGDDNVHYQGSERLINAMIERGKVFTMMTYPNRTHGIYEGPGTTLHLYNLLTRYLKENLPAGPGPVS